MKRSEAREILFALIFETSYEYPFESEGARSIQDIYENAREYRDFEDSKYIRDVYFDIWERLPEIDKAISDCAKGWKQGRLSKCSMSIMRLCVYEMLYVDDVPWQSAINEAVELAKKYDHEKAPGFINGVVNSVANNLGIKEKSSENTAAKPDEGLGNE